MTKLRDRLTSGASRRSSRAQKAWNVDSHSRCWREPSRRSMRSPISSAALLVKVTASTSSGAAWPSPIRYAVR